MFEAGRCAGRFDTRWRPASAPLPLGHQISAGHRLSVTVNSTLPPSCRPRQCRPCRRRDRVTTVGSFRATLKLLPIGCGSATPTLVPSVLASNCAFVPSDTLQVSVLLLTPSASAVSSSVAVRDPAPEKRTTLPVGSVTPVLRPLPLLPRKPPIRGTHVRPGHNQRHVDDLSCCQRLSMA